MCATAVITARIGVDYGRALWLLPVILGATWPETMIPWIAAPRLCGEPAGRSTRLTLDVVIDTASAGNQESGDPGG